MKIKIKNMENNAYEGSYVYQLEKPRIDKMGFIYLNMNDINHLYFYMNNGSTKGFSNFREKAIEIAVYVNHTFQFRDEQRLFEIFQERFPDWFNKRRIDCFGRLIQYFS